MWAGSAHAEKIACPAMQGSHPLFTVSVFDGPPEERADLMPDDSTAKNNVPAYAYAKWTVDYVYDAGRSVYLLCKYKDSEDTITVKAEKKVTTCIYQEHGKTKPDEMSCK